MEAMNVVKNFVLHAYGAPGKVASYFTHTPQLVEVFGM